MLKVLIVDDNYEYMQNLFNIINENIDNNIKIVKICGDGKTALEYILNTNLDIILLDLNIPNINGIEILKVLKEKNLEKNVIVITGESEMLLNLIKNNLSVKQIFIKPFNYQDLMHTFESIINDSLNNEKRSKILKILNVFNFNKSNIGYKYIEKCITYCVEKNYKSIYKIKDLYKEISLNDNYINELNISWNISKSIQTMNRFTDNKTLQKYFPCNTSPTPKVFINQILNMYYES